MPCYWGRERTYRTKIPRGSRSATIQPSLSQTLPFTFPGNQSTTFWIYFRDQKTFSVPLTSVLERLCSRFLSFGLQIALKAAFRPRVLNVWPMTPPYRHGFHRPEGSVLSPKVSMGLSECGCAWTDPNHTSLSQLRRIHSTINRPDGRFIQLNEGRLLGQTGDTVTRGARGWRSNDSCPWFPCGSLRVSGLTSPSLLPYSHEHP